MSNSARLALLVAIALIVIVLAAFFIGFLLRLALIVALLSIAYYFLSRAIYVHRNRPGR